MTRQNIEKMINDSIEKLRNYNDKAKARINNLKYREKDIQEGLQLLFEIQRGEIFEDETGRTLEYEHSMEDELEKLRNELMKTSNLVSLLKGDISYEVYLRKDKQFSDFSK